MKKKVLVTGGAGFIGSHTVDLLLKEGFDVRILDNLSRFKNRNWPSYLNKNAEKFKGDVTSKKDWERALYEIDYVVHLAALMDLLPEYSKFFEINTVGTANMYEVISKRNYPIQKVVVASSQFVYGQGRWKCSEHGVFGIHERSAKELSDNHWDVSCPVCGDKVIYIKNTEDYFDPPNAYAISKYTQEHIALNLGKMCGVPSTVLRYSIVHGSRQSIQSLYSGALRQFVLYTLFDLPLFTYEDGRQLRDFISVKDVASANVFVLANNKTNWEVYNVGGEKAYSILQLSEMVSKEMDSKDIALPSGKYRVGDIRHAISDTTKLRKLGWKPFFSETENIKEFIEWVKTCRPKKSEVLESINKLNKKVKTA